MYDYFDSDTIRHMTSTCMLSVRTVCRKPPYYLRRRLGSLYRTCQVSKRSLGFIAIVWALGVHRHE